MDNDNVDDDNDDDVDDNDKLFTWRSSLPCAVILPWNKTETENCMLGQYIF